MLDALKFTESPLGVRICVAVILTAIYLLSLYLLLFIPKTEKLTPLSVSMLVTDHQIHINNLGKESFELWGTKFNAATVALEKEAVVVPTLPYNYHLPAESMEKEVLTKLGSNGNGRFSFFLFVKDFSGNKLTLECGMWAIVKDGKLTIETQMRPQRNGWEI